MKKRANIVAGNWKMNKDYQQGRDLTLEIVNKLQPSETVVILCPPFTHLQNTHTAINDISNLHLGAQNCHQEEGGAYTGEISTSMLKSCGCDFVIIGHSERREFFSESDELLARKVDRALATGLRPIFCCGEPLPIREKGTHAAHVSEQVKNGLFHLPEEQMKEVVIAYEPIWAIGTGKTASPEQAQEMHQVIRSLLAKQYSEALAERISILYGGSVKPANAAELFAKPDVDGGLVGGASLKADDFIGIINHSNEALAK